MPRPKRTVESALEAKGFRKESKKKDHHRFVYYTEDGRKTVARTKTSHTRKMKDITDSLLRQMAKQCKVSKQQFLELIDCPLGREEFEAFLRDNGLL